MNLLVGYDASDEATQALEYAIDIATALDATVTVGHVIEPSVLEVLESEPITTLSDADGRLIIERIEDAENRGLRLLERAEETATEHAFPVETVMLYGDPARELVRIADEEEFDGIVVGNRGRSPRMGYLMGSVARAIVERATVPVTVVR